MAKYKIIRKNQNKFFFFLTFPTGTSLVPPGIRIFARYPSSPDSNPNVALSVSISANMSPEKKIYLLLNNDNKAQGCLEVAKMGGGGSYPRSGHP